MSGFIQMPDGHPGALGSATAEKAQGNYTAAPVAACVCRSLRAHAPLELCACMASRARPVRERQWAGWKGPRKLRRICSRVGAGVFVAHGGLRATAYGEQAEDSHAGNGAPSSDAWCGFGMRHQALDPEEERKRKRSTQVLP